MNSVTKVLHHLFLPKESNNYKPKVLHLNFLTFYLLLALIFSVGVKKINSSEGDVLGFATDINSQSLLQLTNEQRANNGLPPLTYNQKLSNAAYEKAQDMFAKGYWAHFAPDGSTTPWGFITGSGYSYKVAGENLAKNFYTNSAVVNAWMNSPTHRANILRPEYKDIGFAVVNGNLAGEETTLVVQMFGTPLVAVPEESKPDEQTQAVQVQPTVVATIAPTAPAEQPRAVITTEPLNNTDILSNQATTSPKINLFPISFNISLIFITFLGAALALDFYFSKKLKIVRIEGKHLAHIMFLGFVLISIWSIHSGGLIR
jgi:hypothetical protein